MGATYGVSVVPTVERGGSAFLTIRATVENGAVAAALRVIRGELSRTDRGASARDYAAGLWAVARAYNARLRTPADWRDAALEAGANGWPLTVVDDVPRVLATFSDANAARAAEQMRRCAKEGVVSFVGDEERAWSSVDQGWPATIRPSSP
jgi:hypothetical protein